MLLIYTATDSLSCLELRQLSFHGWLPILTVINPRKHTSTKMLQQVIFFVLSIFLGLSLFFFLSFSFKIFLCLFTSNFLAFALVNLNRVSAGEKEAAATSHQFFDTEIFVMEDEQVEETFPEESFGMQYESQLYQV